MKLIYSVPLLSTAQRTPNNGISQVVLNLAKYLPEFGYRITEDPFRADMFVHHAGEGRGQAQVAICHGLYPTANKDLQAPSALYQINANVIADIVNARRVIVPSAWVAGILEREMHLKPDIVRWGVSAQDFYPVQKPGDYVLWNKNRANLVCDPVWMNRVARELPNVNFVSTFGETASNVKIVGRQEKPAMNDLIRNAGVYLATTKETGDIGTREALACGVPVVAFAQGAVLDLVRHGVNGYLVAPGNVKDLARGITYCLKFRNVLSRNALKSAKGFGWREPVARTAQIFDEVLQGFSAGSFKVSVVIPCFNYASEIAAAVKSAAEQTTKFEVEIIVVDDGSTDDTPIVLQELEKQYSSLHVLRQSNKGVAAARNAGIEKARGQFVVCLDADDRIAPTFIEKTASALAADDSLGIAYTGLQLATGGTTGWPPPKVDYDKQFSGQNQIPTCALFRREDWARVGGYRSYMQPSEDADFFTRLLLFTGKKAAMVTQEPLFIYSVHNDSLSAEYRGRGKIDPFTARGEFELGRRRPMAAPLSEQGSQRSNPVRDYDNPVIDIQVKGRKRQDILTTLDSLENQTMRNWRLVGRKPNTAWPFAVQKPELPAPLFLSLQAGTWLAENFLQEALKQNEFPPFEKGKMDTIMACGCQNKLGKTEIKEMTNEDFQTARFLGGGRGRIWVGSPTGKRFNGISSTRAYGYRRNGEVFRVHKDDIKAAPHLFEVVNAFSELEVKATPVIPPPPVPEKQEEKKEKAPSKRSYTRRKKAGDD